MFNIDLGDNGIILLRGRFDASHAKTAKEILDSINTSCIVDFNELEYISSAGLGLLLGTQKRLGETGDSLRLINLNRHIREIFHIAGFDLVFDIE
jgi:anti-sigma B factor antagonist